MEHDCTDFGMEKKLFPGDGVVTGTGTVSGRQVSYSLILKNSSPRCAVAGITGLDI